jgi:NADH dehydrogenase FAD-containing subunit
MTAFEQTSLLEIVVVGGGAAGLELVTLLAIASAAGAARR